jgi:uncharacterized protein (UPF0264 family)
VTIVRLLVSVRNSREAARAVAGGAEIVDAKEPAAGGLGQVSGDVLSGIRAAVPGYLPLSAALGDVAGEDSVARALDAVTAQVAYVKLGFKGLREAPAVARLVERAVALAGRHPGRPTVIAVAYADYGRAASLAPQVIAGLLAGTGAGGLLVDTCFKDMGDLFRHTTAAELSAIAASLAADDLLLALGGGLGARHVALARDTGASVLGVRGAACEGGRTGVVTEDRVRSLAAAIGRESLAEKSEK